MKLKIKNGAGQELELGADDLRGRITECTQLCLEHGQRLGDLRAVAADKRSASHDADLRESANIIRFVEGEMRAYKVALDALEPQAPARPESRGPDAANSDIGQRRDARTPGQVVSQDEEYLEWAKRGAKGVSPGVRVGSTWSTGTRALIDSTFGTGTGADAGVFVPRGTPYLPVSAMDRRRLFIRDLLPVGQTDLNMIPYIRERTPRTTEEGALTVVEGTQKPEVDMLFDEADAPVRTIAAWVPVTKQIMQDAPTLRTYIDGRLQYMVALREEEQLLNGDGTGSNILGIRMTTGVQTVGASGSTGMNAAAAGDNATSIARGFAQVENVDGDVDGIAMNPLDYWAMVTRRAGVDAHYDSGSPFSGPIVGLLWGVPTVRTRSLPVGHALVGAYRIAAQLFDREETTVTVGDQHLDYFTTNKLAILAEERVALAVYRPDWFSEVIFAA